MRLSRVFIAAVAVLSVAACDGSRGHDQLAGTYAFTLTEQLAGTDATDCPEALDPASWGGPLVKSGDYVRIDTGLHEIFAVGYYRYDLEEFSLDGTAQDVATQGGGCVVDQIRVHLEGVTESPTAFTGTMSIDYDDPETSCRCAVRALFRAERQ